MDIETDDEDAIDGDGEEDSAFFESEEDLAELDESLEPVRLLLTKVSGVFIFKIHN